MNPLSSRAISLQISTMQTPSGLGSVVPFKCFTITVLAPAVLYTVCIMVIISMVSPSILYSELIDHMHDLVII